MYQIGQNVLGFQFHPEITPQTLELFLENDDEVAIFHGEYVQPANQLKQSKQSKFIEGNQLLNQAIEYVVNAS